MHWWGPALGRVALTKHQVNVTRAWHAVAAKRVPVPHLPGGSLSGTPAEGTQGFRSLGGTEYGQEEPHPKCTSDFFMLVSDKAPSQTPGGCPPALHGAAYRARL